MLVAERKTYKEKLQAVREADRKHYEKMTEICARGGKTYEQFQSMSMHDKDRFMVTYGDAT